MSALTDELSARVARLEDRSAIRQLSQEYKEALDGKDFGAYANVFAADGEFVAQEARARGRGEIRALVEGMLGNLLSEETGQDLHVVLNSWLDDPREDRCRAEVTWLYVVRGDGGEPVLAKLGHYEDLAVREVDGRWRFGRRRAPTDIPAT